MVRRIELVRRPAAAHHRRRSHVPFASARLAVVLLGLESVARAADPPQAVDLRYTAPPECPSEQTFRGLLRSRTDRITFSPAESAPRFVAAVRAEQHGYAGRVEIEGPDGRISNRSVGGPTCDDVAQALSLIIALAVDPNALVTPPSARAASDTDTTAQSSETRDVAPPIPTSNPSPSSPAERPAEPALPARTAPQAHWRAGLGAGVRAATGVLPSAAFAGTVFFEVAKTARTGPAFRLTAGATPLHSYSEWGGKTHYQWTFAALHICPLRTSLGAATVGACAFAEGGALSADATGFEHSESHPPRLWAAWGLLARAEWSIGALWVEGTAGPHFALTRPSYRIELPESTTVHSVSTVGISAAASMGFRLP